MRAVKCSERSRYSVHCFDVRILKWYVGINHIIYFLYAGIYPRTKLIVLNMKIKYLDLFNGKQRFLCTPIVNLLKEQRIQDP